MKLSDLLADYDEVDHEADGELPDVTAECPYCTPEAPTNAG